MLVVALPSRQPCLPPLMCSSAKSMAARAYSLGVVGRLSRCCVPAAPLKAKAQRGILGCARRSAYYRQSPCLLAKAWVHVSTSLAWLEVVVGAASSLHPSRQESSNRSRTQRDVTPTKVFRLHPSRQNPANILGRNEDSVSTKFCLVALVAFIVHSE